MRRYYFSAFLLVVSSEYAHAGCLDAVAAFANEICGEINTSGNAKLTEADGRLKAEVSGIVRRVIGDAGGTIDVKNLQETYENVLREDLPQELFNLRDCRAKMAEAAIAEECKGAAPDGRSSIAEGQQSVVEPASDMFRMEGGTTRFVGPDRVLLSMVGTPCGANSSFVCIVIDGTRHNLTLGQQAKFATSAGDCRLTLAQIEKGKNAAQFHLKC